VNEEGSLRAAIVAQPDEDTPRLVYADWLDEHGDPDRAAFIRLRVREAQVPVNGPEYNDIWRQVHPLYRKNEDRWLADLPPVLRRRASVYQFKRGFLTSLRVTAAQVPRIPKRAWARHPIQELELDEVTGRLDQVLALPQLNRIRYLRLLAWQPTKGLLASDLAALAACPNLTGLRELSVSTAVGNPIAGALARCPSLRGLTSLWLSDDNLDDDGVALLTEAGADNLRRLKGLGLESRRIRAGTARALAGAAALAALEKLNIDRSSAADPGQIGDEGVAALARSPHLAGLRDLWLRFQGIGPEGARALAATPYLTRLRTLDLGGNRPGAAGVRALAAGPWPELTELALNHSKLGDEAAEALAGSGRLTGLTSLKLEYNDIGPAGVAALSRAPWLSGLVSLNLEENPIGNDGARALCESKTLTGLKKLRVPGSYGQKKLSPAVVKALKKRFGDVG
jgi:uncharacterized protein (TIGR02996 family)